MPTMTHLTLPLLLASLGVAAGASAGQASAPARTFVQDDAVYQLRIYRIFDETRTAFHERFRDHAARIMARHGFDVVAMWEARGEAGPEFVYLLRWPDEAAMTARWERFMADEEWAEIKRNTAAEHGRFVDGIEEKAMYLTDYSPAGIAR